MAVYKIAHIREQGVNLIIIPLESAFGMRSLADQRGVIAALQSCASSAGLAGTVVPVWQEGNSHRFIAPQKWKAYFESLGWNDILRNINKELSCFNVLL